MVCISSTQVKNRYANYGRNPVAITAGRRRVGPIPPGGAHVIRDDARAKRFACGADFSRSVRAWCAHRRRERRHMKVLHVVTLVTPDGAYGGPTRVAANLCSALRDQGHDAVIAAGVSGFDEPPAAVGGVPAHLFPARRVIRGFGYAATHAPALGPWIDEHAPKFDIVHVHLARDLVTLPTAARLRRMRIPFVVQTHGMIVPRSHPLAPAIDRLWTVRVLRSAAMALHLTQAERRDLCAVGGSGLRLRQLPNGVPMTAATASGQRSAALPEVLFFARLHERKRPEVFAEAALSLLRSGSVRNSPSSGLRREPKWGLMRSFRRRVQKGSARSSFGGSRRCRRISRVSEWPAHPYMCCPLCGSRSP